MLSHFTNTTNALAQSLTNGSAGIRVYNSTATKVYSVIPANNLNVTIVAQALATNKSVKGISLDTSTLEIKEDQMLSPIEKTLSNCVLGS